MTLLPRRARPLRARGRERADSIDDELDRCSHGYTASQSCAACDAVLDVRESTGHLMDHAFRITWANGDVQCTCGHSFESREALEHHIANPDEDRAVTPAV